MSRQVSPFHVAISSLITIHVILLQQLIVLADNIINERLVHSFVVRTSAGASLYIDTIEFISLKVYFIKK